LGDELFFEFHSFFEGVDVDDGWDVFGVNEIAFHGDVVVGINLHEMPGGGLRFFRRFCALYCSFTMCGLHVTSF